MNHHKSKRKLSRKSTQRNALLKALAVALIMKEKIRTTEAKAKELRPFIERIITNAKPETVAAKRFAASKIGQGVVLKKFFSDIVKAQKDRKGGYTRITKLPKRLKDASKMAMIEFVK